MQKSPYATGDMEDDYVNNKNGQWCEFPFAERKHYAAGQHPAATEVRARPPYPVHAARMPSST